MQCETCYYWEELRYDLEKTKLGLGECTKAQLFDNETEWSNVEGEIERVERDPSVMMYVQDGSSYSATLYTKANFFCAHHEIGDEE